MKTLGFETETLFNLIFVAHEVFKQQQPESIRKRSVSSIIWEGTSLPLFSRSG